MSVLLKEKFLITKNCLPIQRLISERDKLKDVNEELKYAQLNHGTMRTDGSPSTNSVDTLDMIPPEIK